jgi:hypothetical protein
MQRIAVFIMMGIAGLILAVITSLTVFPVNVLGAVFGGMLPLMAILQIFGIAKQKNFLPLYKDLDKNEKYEWVPDTNNRIHLTIMKSNHKGLLYLKGLGLFEDKGTTFLFGKDKMGFAFPESGYTGDIPTIQYFSQLFRDNGVSEWDEFVKLYLYPSAFEEFKKRFRQGKKPTIDNINAELEWLSQRPMSSVRNDLKQQVFGETVDFRSRCRFLKYNYDPVAAENATEAEKIIAYKKAVDYKDPKEDFSKYSAVAKAVVLIIMGLVIFMAVASSIDLSNFMGMFGG